MRSEWISVHVLCGCEWAPAHVLPAISSSPLCFFGSRIRVVSSKHFLVHVLCGMFVILPFSAVAAVICVRGPPLSGHALASHSLFVLNARHESMSSSIHDPRSQSQQDVPVGPLLLPACRSSVRPRSPGRASAGGGRRVVGALVRPLSRRRKRTATGASCSSSTPRLPLHIAQSTSRVASGRGGCRLTPGILPHFPCAAGE